MLFDYSFTKFLRVSFIYDNVRDLDYEQPDQVFYQGGLESGSHLVNQIANAMLVFYFI